MCSAYMNNGLQQVRLYMGSTSLEITLDLSITLHNTFPMKELGVSEEKSPLQRHVIEEFP